jgi:hypothetical protein
MNLILARKKLYDDIFQKYDSKEILKFNE